MPDIRLNLIQFIRGVEPREKVDLLLPVQKFLELVELHQLKATFLIQYDALTQGHYAELLKQASPERAEIGLWLEVVEPQALAASIPWRGRFPWDWHAHCGFLVGYSPEERVRLIDTAFSAFRNQFGRYPRAVGSWIIDAFSLGYIRDTYGIDAACICRDQYGMDGYTLWGGYFNGGYYPNKRNVLCPAQAPEHRLDVPVFRMSGSDPIYDYDLDLDYPGIRHTLTVPLISLEAGCPEGGASPEWLRWITAVYGAAQPFGYMQPGQENSFGWDFMASGLRHQAELAAKLKQSGKAAVETLSETGRWFRNAFPETPVLTLPADDWRGDGRFSLWYQCPRYRMNVFFEENQLWIRDLHFYHDAYCERYLHLREEGDGFIFDALPFTEGRLWSSKEHRAGLFFCDASGARLTGPLPEVRRGPRETELIWATESGMLRLQLSPEEIFVSFGEPGCFMKNTWVFGGEQPVPFRRAKQGLIEAEHNGFCYDLSLTAGTAALTESALCLYPNAGGCCSISGVAGARD